MSDAPDPSNHDISNNEIVMNEADVRAATVSRAVVPVPTTVKPPHRPLVIPDVPEGEDPWTYLPPVDVGRIPPNKYCRAWNGKRQKYCKSIAGRGTTHPGQGRCRRHRGLVAGDPRLKSGRYSVRNGITHPRIADLYAKFAADPEPLNLLDELAMMRALAVHHIETHAAITEAMLAWHADLQLTRRPLPESLVEQFERGLTRWETRMRADERWNETTKQEAAQARRFLTIVRGGTESTRPRRVPDISEASSLLELVGKMAERVDTMRSKNAVSEAELNRIINAMARAIDVLIPDEPLKQQIREAWLAIVTR